MKALHIGTWILFIVGGVNWLVVGAGGFMDADWNVVGMLLGSMPALENLVYVLVGLSAVYELVVHRKNCRECGSSAPAAM